MHDRSITKDKAAPLSRRSLLAGIAAGGVGLCTAGRSIAARARRGADRLVYIGMHGDRIHAARFDSATGALRMIGPVADQSAPTWAVLHPEGDIVYYVREDGNDGMQSGAVHAYRIDHRNGALHSLGETLAKGGGTTHLHLDVPSMTILAANFGGSTISTIPLQADGRLGAVSSVLTEAGSGPLKRQSHSHPHGIFVDPGGRYALVPDLGADRIFVHRFDRHARALLPDRPDRPIGFATPPGTGPRHLAFHPNGRLMFALTELSGEVMSFRWDMGSGQIHLIEAHRASSPSFTGERSVSELAISADGRFLYLTDRGENRIVVHAIDPVTGRLRFLQRLSCGGAFPWHFAIDPSGRWMLVANERSNRIEVFRIDTATGHVSETHGGLDTPRPVHILFAGDMT